jgi:hypothetical protein
MLCMIGSNGYVMHDRIQRICYRYGEDPSGENDKRQQEVRESRVTHGSTTLSALTALAALGAVNSPARVCLR